MELALDSIVAAVDGQVFCDLAGETAILNLQQDRYFGLDQIGTEVWHAIQKPRSVRDLHQLLLPRYEVDSERLETDILSLLAHMHREGLIEIRTPYAAL